MEENYITNDKSKKWLGILLVIVAGILIGIVIFIWVKGSQKLVSPIPSKPSFEVIFYTPTPGPVSPSATPSATPKVKKTPTPKPSPKATVTPTIKVTLSPTVKPTPE